MTMTVFQVGHKYRVRNSFLYSYKTVKFLCNFGDIASLHLSLILLIKIGEMQLLYRTE